MEEYEQLIAGIKPVIVSRDDECESRYTQFVDVIDGIDVSLSISVNDMDSGNMQNGLSEMHIRQPAVWDELNRTRSE